MATVYAILNLKTRWVYVGSTSNYGARKYRHQLDLMQGRHHCIRLQRSWNKHGEQAFVFKIIAKNVDRPTASKVEQALLDDLSLRTRLYNTSLSAVYGNTLGNHPKREALIAKRVARWKEWLSSLTVEERKSLYGRSGTVNGMWGKTHTKSVKKRLSKMMQGNQFALGSKRTDEHKARLSDMASKRTGESNPFFGKHHSNRTKAKLREQALGRKPVNLRPIKVEGIRYESVSEAARQLGVVAGTICYRLRSGWKGYKYIDINA